MTNSAQLSRNADGPKADTPSEVRRRELKVSKDCGAGDKLNDEKGGAGTSSKGDEGRHAVEICRPSLSKACNGNLREL
jgi:hypothetical protein